MKKDVYISGMNCITPLGFSVEENFDNLIGGISGIKRHENEMVPNAYFSAIVEDARLNAEFAKKSSSGSYTKLEKMMILALCPIVEKSKSDLGTRTAFLLSTTKGNITALESGNIQKAQLHDLAQTVADFFGFKSEPIVVSNACVSGILAISVAKRLIQSGLYDQAFVVAGDLVSEFVLSGFNSFQAMSDAPCKPYSKNRTGVTLGEAAAAVLVTSDASHANARILGDGSMNDANHISGPSRTGEGLVLSVESALKEANLPANKIDYISAHGTATPFNDEMEAIAFNRLGLQDKPLHSLKGFYGHTLGASGLLETVIGIEALKQNKLIASAGFDEIGVSQNVNVIRENEDRFLRYFLKTASGFGGCNTAVVFEKEGSFGE
ncbi:beta-ketoacyl synthase N-terminal-like domain-containing protein [Flavobacterium selenitireducens]|uniref:beta-ketoacyl synthase N-terminal-like domain-containing protein n=1 Tax=Flavobacterium selenitireducens TaxID=2722704 RepID=UPI00168C0B02|nr:beta-ketoacyl synthase N-terminal-like domain-containing protein [Flavobacterium selenitireducens]MBD3582168.1 beta-ketoacyl synthase [Flavobacterium selenitireducens]